MKVSTMRNVDFYVGIPLCFVGTLTKKVFSLFARRSVKDRPKNVLFIELSEMGSTILVDPAMQKLKREVPESQLFFAIFESCEPSLYLLNTIQRENVFTIRDRNIPVLALDTLRFLLWARRRRIDTVVDLELFSRFTALLTGFCGARNVIGFYPFNHEGLYRGNFLTHRVGYNPHIHVSKNFVALVHALLAQKAELPFSKIQISDEDVRLRKVTITEHQREEVRAIVRWVYPAYTPERNRIVLVNPNASELLPQRRWMPEHFSELIRKILAEHQDVLVLLTGAPSEKEQAERLRISTGSERCINFAGEVKFTQLTSLYDISLFMITNDSGPAHFASVTRMPTYVLFGPETPALYGSLGETTPIYAALACSPCVAATNHRKTPCRDNVCLQVIRPAGVYQVVKPALEARTAQVEQPLATGLPLGFSHRIRAVELAKSDA